MKSATVAAAAAAAAAAETVKHRITVLGEHRMRYRGPAVEASE